MVKGSTRQVILVKSPDPNFFEEAIFIVKDEAVQREGVSTEQVIRQARQAADGYLKGCRPKSQGDSLLFGAIWGVTGAVLASLIWCIILCWPA